ncbi:MAG: glycine reductase [Acidobacteria bacterium]|nr:glycine reductase [Acidobacteriota bacterium]
MGFPVVKAVSYALAHTPDLVRYGSKPERELRKEPALFERMAVHLQGFEQACAYPPNQVCIGNLAPEALWDRDTPWWQHGICAASRFGRYGEIMPEAEFYGLLGFADEFDLVLLEQSFMGSVRERLQEHRLFHPEDLNRLGTGHSIEKIDSRIAHDGAYPLYFDGRVVGCICRGHDEDPFLAPGILLENLACKATGILAIRWLFELHGSEEINPLAIDYVINSGEEAIGDRYQRGAGNLAKAMAELSGCANSTGGDVKAFCCGPIHSLVMAAGLVQSGIFQNVLVVGGGALAKLGMKFRGHLAHQMPILEDVLASFAILIGPDDGKNPSIRLDAIGKHDVRYSGSAQEIAQALIAMPLDKLGRKIPEIDRYAVELHNPEVTEPAGSGNVPRYNYKMIASLGVIRKEWPRESLNDFEKSHGLPGFSPTQGHVASAIPYLGHARDAMLRDDLQSAMFIGKGSLFLGKMTNLSDGMSFILEAQVNPNRERENP